MSLVSVVYQSEPKNVAAGNPMGYWPRFLTDPDGAMADALANTLKLKCIGTWFWDLGGATNWYVATPWLCGGREAFYDKWFAAFRDAGLRIGGTIRPRLRLKNKPVETSDPYGALAERVDYANSRWGWTEFYCDDVWKTQHNNSKEELLGPDVYRRLVEEYPGCAFYPEQVRKDHEGLLGVRPLQFFPNPPQNATPPIIKVEMDFRANANQLNDLATSFRRGAWGLVSATNPDSPSMPNLANRLMAWAAKFAPAAATAAAERTQ